MDIDVESLVFQLIHKACDDLEDYDQVPELHREVKLADLLLDSLKLIEIVFEVENKLGVQADEDLMAELTTLNDVIRMFEKAQRSLAAVS